MKVLLLGGGMITHDQILPSLYQLQRQGRIGEISCARCAWTSWSAGRSGEDPRGISGPVVPPERASRFRS